VAYLIPIVLYGRGGVFSFKDIDFGFTDAEKESVRSPDLLLNGFIDPEDAIDHLVNRYKFLVLGYKGSGKSSISEHIRLLFRDDSMKFVNNISLSDLSYNTLNKVMSGDSESEAKLPTVWSWLLLIQLIHSFTKDHGAINNLESYEAKIDGLKGLGLLPTSDLKSMVLLSSKHSFKGKLAEVGEISFGLDRSFASSQDIVFTELVKILKELVRNYTTDSKHILIIDGLDDILTRREIQIQALGALIFEINKLNLMLVDANVNAKIIVLCRTDLYERLYMPNKNKIKQDDWVSLNWYNDTRDEKNSLLIELANKRCKLKYETVDDLFQTFFNNSEYTEGVRSFLLNQTRHTPRDFLQLLRCIQGHSNTRKISKNTVFKGIASYSKDYLISEINDELVGYLKGEEIDSLIRLLGSIGKREFTYSELSMLAQKKEDTRDLDLMFILPILYNCSAIGNVIRSRRYSFKYRNRGSSFDETQKIAFHAGLWKVFNLI